MHLPADWTRILPPDAPLTTLERWERVFADTKPGDWPEGVDRSSFVLDILRLLAKGTVVAAEAGERLLPTLARKLSDRALEDGPPAALPVTLASLRIEDGLEPASHPIWTSAVSLASAPRPFVRLLGLNAGRWPRRISEDRLIPDHIIPIEEVDPLPLADADRRDFATIIASAQSAIISFSRRDVEGRLLGRSPLIADFKESYLNRSRTPEHCTSESDPSRHQRRDPHSCAAQSPFEFLAAIAIARLLRVSGSFSMVMLPMGSAMVPRMKATVTGATL
ncbi:MAG: hypothetical protein ACXWH1_08795 [Thermoanaerobaculia bacterium]